MVRLVMIHSVKDFDEFIARFHEGDGRRELRGIVRHWVHRSVDNPSEVMVTLELETRAAAEALLAEGHLIQAWIERAGVDIYPAVFIGEVVASGAVTTPRTSCPRCPSLKDSAGGDPRRTGRRKSLVA